MKTEKIQIDLTVTITTAIATQLIIATIVQLIASTFRLHNNYLNHYY